MTRNPNRVAAGVVLALVIATAACYWQVLDFDFINMDDTVYVSQNRFVRQGISMEGIRWACITTEAANWHPVTWLSLMLDTEIYGTGAGGYHGTNLLFHIANTLLLFFIFRNATGSVWRSGMLAALFALHPLHVESVAWISERKDVLSTFFGFLSMGFYVRYVSGKRKVDYLASLLFLSIGLMAKPMLVTWPCVFLLLDYWPLGRMTDGVAEDMGVPKGGGLFPKSLPGLILEKLPFTVPVFLSCLSTLMAQGSQGAVISFNAIDLKTRMANGLISYVSYLSKTVWPGALSIFYPYRDHTYLLPQALGAACLVGGVAVFAVLKGRRYPYLPVGLFWYLGTLVPVIGIVQVGAQAMADRYTYIPLIGIFFAGVWGAVDFWRYREWNPKGLAAVAFLILIAVGVRTGIRVGYWESSLSLFENAVRIDSGNDLAHNNLGAALANRGETEKALAEYRRALEINPRNADARNNMANRLSASGNLSEAERHYRMAIEIDPTRAVYHYNLGALLARIGKEEAAIREFGEALALDPYMANAYNYMGLLLAGRGKISAAAPFFLKALEVDPEFEPARWNLERYGLDRPQSPGHRTGTE